jgi:hypothetical protein
LSILFGRQWILINFEAIDHTTSDYNNNSIICLLHVKEKIAGISCLPADHAFCLQRLFSREISNIAFRKIQQGFPYFIF